MKVLEDKKISDFTKVMILWAFKRMDARDLKPGLKKYVRKASEEYTGFGGNIMDPRVGTHIPSVKNSLQLLLAEWEK